MEPNDERLAERARLFAIAKDAIAKTVNDTRRDTLRDALEKILDVADFASK